MVPEDVSGAGAAEFPLVAQTYFGDSRSPLRSPLRDLPLPLTRFSARSAPFSAAIPLRSHALYIGYNMVYS